MATKNTDQAISALERSIDRDKTNLQIEERKLESLKKELVRIESKVSLAETEVTKLRQEMESNTQKLQGM